MMEIFILGYLLFCFGVATAVIHAPEKEGDETGKLMTLMVWLLSFATAPAIFGYVIIRFIEEQK